MGRNFCGCKGRCDCKRPREIVYPTKNDVKNCYTEETVKHIHPSHTTIVNNHTIKNEHLFPHTTSCENRVREIDVRGTNERPRNEVQGVASHHKEHCHRPNHCHRGCRRQRLCPCGCGRRMRGWL